MCVSEELETTMNGDEKHVGISDAYFHIYIYIRKGHFWRRKL
jgi:hypothetical protein